MKEGIIMVNGLLIAAILTLPILGIRYMIRGGRRNKQVTQGQKRL
jgi:hypothetical protein